MSMPSYEQATAADERHPWQHPEDYRASADGAMVQPKVSPRYENLDDGKLPEAYGTVDAMFAESDAQIAAIVEHERALSLIGDAAVDAEALLCKAEVAGAAGIVGSSICGHEISTPELAGAHL